MNPRYRSRVGAPQQLAADAAASAIYCAMPFLVVHYLGDWRLTPPWLVLPAGMLAVTLYCLIRELSTVMIADGNICLRCLGFKVTEFPLEELRSAKLIFKNGQCSRVYLSVHEETDLRRALRTANRRGGKSIQFAATTKRLEQLTKLVLLQPCDYAKKEERNKPLQCKFNDQRISQEQFTHLRAPSKDETFAFSKALKAETREESASPRKSMKNHKKLFLILAVVAVLLISALSFVAPYYRCYRDFRQKTNYHFASVQDFLYQTQQKDQFSVQFIDQNAVEFTAGQQTVRAMSFESKGDIKYMLAIQETGRWGDYYRFLPFEFDAMEVLGTYNADTGACAEPYASYTAMFLNDGCLIQVLSETPYVDTLGGPAYSWETSRIYNDDSKDYRYFQLFWVEGDLPTDYEIYSDASSDSIHYREIMDSVRTWKALREASN